MHGVRLLVEAALDASSVVPSWSLSLAVGLVLLSFVPTPTLVYERRHNTNRSVLIFVELRSDEHTHGLVQARAHSKPFFVGADENKETRGAKPEMKPRMRRSVKLGLGLGLKVSAWARVKVRS